MFFKVGPRGYMTRQIDQKYKTVTNWLFFPEKKLFFKETNEVVFIGMLKIFYKKFEESHYIELNMKTLSSPASIQKIHPEVVTKIAPVNLPDFKQFFMEVMRSFDLMDESKAVRKYGIIKDKKERIYVGPGITTGNVKAITEDVFLDCEMLKMKPTGSNFRQYILDMRNLHFTYIIDQIMWWCAGVMLKNFTEKKIKVPILFSYGRNNTGKTALHKRIIGNMFSMGFMDDYETYGYFEPTMLNLSGQTLPTLQRHADISNFHPMMCDEFKYERDESIRVMMSKFFRSNYDESVVQKAKGLTSSMVSMMTSRPISMTGESAFKSEGAILDRSLLVYHRSFLPEHEEAFRSFSWKTLPHIGNILLKALLKAQTVPWERGPFVRKANTSTRNVDTMDFLWNGAKLINDVFSTQYPVYSRETIIRSIDMFADHINIENANLIDEFFAMLDTFFESKFNQAAFKIFKRYIMLVDKDLFISFLPFEKWLRKNKFPSTKAAISKLLQPAGFIEWTKNGPSELKYWSSMARFDVIKFMTVVNTAMYPSFFANVELIKPADEIKVKNINYEDL